MIGIYKITNKINNKFYIGRAYDLEQRWIKHQKYLGHGAPYLHRAILKYGIENFKFEIIEECSLEELRDKEEFWIKKLNSRKLGYNITKGGRGGGDYWFYRTEEENNLTRKKLSEINKGRIHSERTRKNMSEAHKGKPTWNKGKTNIYSEESLKIMSEKKKNNKNLLGKKHSEETKKKIGDKNRGKTHKVSGAARKKISEARKDKKLSKETKEKCAVNKGKQCYTNGLINKMDFKCPDGFWLGRIKVNLK